MQDSHKAIVAIVAVALILVIWCRQPKEQMSASMQPRATMVTPQPTDQGGLAALDTDPTDYAPYTSGGAPCATASPFA